MLKKSGFVDFNKYSLDEHVKYLEAYFKFDSSGVACSVHKLIEFYKENSNRPVNVCPKCNYPKFKKHHEDFERCEGCDWTSEKKIK